MILVLKYWRCYVAPARRPPGFMANRGEHDMSTKEATVHEVKSSDPHKNSFDGQKADLYINTGTLGGKHYLVKLHKPDGTPTLIALHL